MEHRGTGVFKADGTVLAVGDDDAARSAKTAPRFFRQRFQRAAQILAAFRSNGFDDQKGVDRVLGQHGALAVAPVPAAAYGAGVVAVADFAGQRRLFRLVAKRQERIAAGADVEAQVSPKGVEILAADGKAPGERHGVVDVHQRVDAAEPLAFFHPFQQRFDRAARALFCFEELEGVAPDRHDGALAERFAGEEFPRLVQRALEVCGDGGAVFHPIGVVFQAAGDDDADLGLGKQVPEWFRSDKAGHRRIVSLRSHVP